MSLLSGASLRLFWQNPPPHTWTEGVVLSSEGLRRTELFGGIIRCRLKYLWKFLCWGTSLLLSLDLWGFRRTTGAVKGSLEAGLWWTGPGHCTSPRSLSLSQSCKALKSCRRGRNLHGPIEAGVTKQMTTQYYDDICFTIVQSSVCSCDVSAALASFPIFTWEFWCHLVDLMLLD